MEPILSNDSEAGIKFVPIGTYRKFGDRTYTLTLTVIGSLGEKTAKARAQEVSADFESMGYLTHIEKTKPKTYNIWLSKPDDRFYVKMRSLQLAM